jgi:RNase adaptor protein for sRNA GlmZ degradation
MQNLGAYGFRGLFERKKRFVESIPAAMAQLNELLCKVEDVLPTLCGLMKEIAAMPRFVPDEHEGLVVDVYSFSYRRGIPEDYSGNGGGFVFDCRAIHNPGRYEPYKKLTGMDEPVKKFLEEQSRIADFLENVYALADTMVEDYLRRGFSHIQLCFGCTGGQHRSVYSAEHTAEHIAKKFGVRVNVNHIMQGVKYTLNK